MAQVVKTRTYGPGDSLSNTDYNDDRDEVIAGVNNIDDSQIAAAANISEGKINFSGSLGHTHNAVSGTPIPVVDLSVAGLTPLNLVRVNAAGTALEAVPSASAAPVQKQFVFYIGKTLVVENNASANLPIDVNMTAQTLSAYVKTPSSGAAIIVAVKTVTGTTIATLTIPAGQNSATTSSMTTPSLVAGLTLRIDVTQIGSTTAGANLTATLTAVTT